MVVHSTTQEEGLGNSMLEAMALGRPLVADRCGSGTRGHGRRPGGPPEPSPVTLKIWLAQILDTVQQPQETRHREERARATWVESQFSQQSYDGRRIYALPGA